MVKNLNFISKLPPELLHKIFKMSDTKFHTGISKAYLPYTRKSLYHSIIIRFVESFKLLCRTLNDNPEIGEYIIALEVQPPAAYSIQRLAITVMEVEEMLKSLSNVIFLLINWCWLASIVTSDLVTKKSLPKLEFLILCDPFVHRWKPWNYKHFKNLKFYSNLKTLILVPHPVNFTAEEFQSKVVMNYARMHFAWDWVEEMDDWDFTDCNIINGLGLSESGDVLEEEEGEGVDQLSTGLEKLSLSNLSSSVTDLRIKGTLTHLELLETILKFQSITSLEISDTFQSKDILNLFNSISTLVANQITSLIIESHPSLTDEIINNEELNLYPSISKFQNLTHLTLPAQGFHSSIFNYLKDPLPLRSLTFGPGTLISISMLKLLLLPTSKGKISTLEVLRLDNIESSLGIKADGVGFYLDVDTINDRNARFKYIPQKGWLIPIWIKEQFEEEGLKELINLGKEVGVKVIGSSVESIGVIEAWREDYRYVANHWRRMRREVNCHHEDDEDEINKLEESFLQSAIIQQSRPVFDFF